MAQHRRDAGSGRALRSGVSAFQTKTDRMKRSQLAILILIVVVLGAVAFLFLRHSTTSWQSGAGQLRGKVVDLPINDVSQITIQQSASQVNLKKEGDTWVVTERANYPANFEMISTLIRSVWGLKPVQ